MTTTASSSEPITDSAVSASAARQSALETGALVPLVVGVSADVVLSEGDIARLPEAVDEFFQFLGFPLREEERSPTPIIVLASLAEGAERLVARRALDQFEATLVVPLPMAQDAYEASFRNDQSRAEFRELLGRAARAFVVDGGDPRGSAEAGASDYAGRRCAAAYVARNCHILFAIGSGARDGDTAGLSEIVRFQLEGVPLELDPGRSPLDLPESGPVYHVVPSPPDADPPVRLPCELLLPSVPTSPEKAREAFGRMRGMIEQYNVDVAAVAPSRTNLDRAAGYLLPADRWPSLTTGLTQTLERYAVADGLALHFQRTMFRVLNLLSVGAFAVALLMQIHSALRRAYPLSANEVNPWYAKALVRIATGEDIWLATYDVPYLAVVVAVVVLYWWSHHRGDQNKYQDYRAVAEGLRVQFYWRLAGLADSAADHYLRKQKGELDWIRGALRVVDILGGPCIPADDPASALRRLRLVTTHWVDDQIQFFVGRARTEEVHGRRARISRGLVRWVEGPDTSADFIGRAQARKDDWKSRKAKSLRHFLLLFVVPAFAVTRGFAPGSHPFVICLVLLSALLVLVGVHARIRSFADHAKQYSRMGITFTNARKHLDYLIDSGALSEAQRIVAARTLLRELGTEALAENADWVLLHRERPLELPRV